MSSKDLKILLDSQLNVVRNKGAPGHLLENALHDAGVPMARAN
jgi:hypothetical protein